MKGSQAFIWMLVVLLLSLDQLALRIESATNQVDRLYELIKSRRSKNPPNAEQWPAELYVATDNDVSPAPYLGAQEGLMQADKIHSLPGQPNGVKFDQYAGYINIDPKVGKALFYYFVESPQNSASKPLVLWLNGGPGCSSLGYGALQELGPFRVNSDGKTLFQNQYSWNNVANVLFLESPVGVGFSYSNRTSDHDNNGDKSTAEDSYTFLINWFDRFPQYKSRDFFITGESYAGHYVPQLAFTILSKNKQTKQKIINLKGIAIGNAWIDDHTGIKGRYDFFWTHAMNSDETNAGINKHCDFLTGNFSNTCYEYRTQGNNELGGIDIYNIYAPSCNLSAPKSSLTGSVKEFDPCSDKYVESYLNLPEVQKAIHATNTSWSGCRSFMAWKDSPTTILPTIQQLISSQIRIWIYSGDIDGQVPITTSRYAINTLKIPVESPWRPWYSNNEVGGYLVGYKGLILITVRGAGHLVPSYQPQRALTMFSFFLQGKLPPSS